MPQIDFLTTTRAKVRTNGNTLNKLSTFLRCEKEVQKM